MTSLLFPLVYEESVTTDEATGWPKVFARVQFAGRQAPVSWFGLLPTDLPQTPEEQRLKLREDYFRFALVVLLDGRAVA